MSQIHSSKSTLYAQSLDLARRRSLWTTSHPADHHGRILASDGGTMDWKELVRKFRKHTGREVTSQTALTEHLLHHLLSRSPSPSPTSPPSPLPVDSHPQIKESLETLETVLSAPSTEIEGISGKVVHAEGRYYLGHYESVLKELEEVDLELPLGGEGEGYDYVLRVLGLLLQGWAAEKLERPTSAKELYGKAATRYDEVCDLVSRNGTGGTSVELHKIGAEALFRNCLLNPTLPSYTLYLTRSTSPTSSLFFPASQRLTTYTSHRLLLPALPSSLTPLSALNKASESILRSTTKLPPAGDVNWAYVNFLTEVTSTWLKVTGGGGKEGSAEVVEIMYRGLSHTFQSHTLLRYLIRGLKEGGKFEESFKALKLYLELGVKARETDLRQVAKDVRRARVRALAGVAEEKKGEKDEEEEEVEIDIDSDEIFVETLLEGARMGVKYLKRGKESLELVLRAKEVFGKGGLGGEKELEGRLEEVWGVALGGLADEEADVDTRSARQASGLTHLSNAVTLNPSSSTAHYHLSYLLAETRQISSATTECKLAAELLSSTSSDARDNKREVWHLLGLLVSAQKDNVGAMEVLETGLDESSTFLPIGEEEGEVGTRNFGSFKGTAEDLVSEIQMRISRNVLIELMEGAESALGDQASLFAVFRGAFEGLSEGAVTETIVENGVNGVTTTNKTGVTTKRATSLLGRKPKLSTATVGSNVDATGSSGTVMSNPIPSLRVSPAGSLSTLSLPSTSPTSERNPRSTKLLVDLWLLSAASYRRAGKLDDSLGAIQQAEELDPDDPDVWTQFALYNLSINSPTTASTSLLKALSLSPSHIPSTIILARSYLSTDKISDVPFALGLLQITKREAWDVPEAWFELSRCHKFLGRKEEEKGALVKALALEETRAVRGWSCLPRVL